MDPTLGKIVNEFFTALNMISKADMVWEKREPSEDSLTAWFKTTDPIKNGDCRLGLTLRVEEGLLNYTIVVNGNKLEEALPALREWLNQRSVISGEGACAT